MLVSFTLGNYRSFDEPVMLSMKSTPVLVENARFNNTHVVRTNCKNISILKSAAIYGANASGKTNFLSGMNEMLRYVYDKPVEGQSVQYRNYRKYGKYNPFVFSDASLKTPTIFEVRFVIHDEIYEYGFEVSDRSIESEWLIRDGKELFSRSSAIFDSIRVSKYFLEAEGLEKYTRDNTLFLSVCNFLRCPIIQEIYAEFWNKIEYMDASVSSFTPWRTDRYAREFLRDEDLRKRVVNFVRQIDIGVQDVFVVEKLEKRTVREIDGIKFVSYKTLEFLHNCETSKPLTFEQASSGTQKFIQLIMTLLKLFDRKGILLVDEIDTKLHSLLLEPLVKLFNSNENKQSQVIFTTHNTYPLRKKLLRRDQVWFVEKRKDLSSRLINLAEYNIPKDALYENDYYEGRYGGIPILEMPEIFEFE
jgi:AAA15 family ATPase/GTPase